MADQLLISAFEAAELLSLSTARLKRMAKRNQVPSVLLPDGEIRFCQADLVEWIGQHKTCNQADASGRGIDPDAAAEKGPPR